MPGKARLGESYVQVVPVIGDLANQLAAQISASLGSGQVTQATQSTGQQIGNQTGAAAGTAAGTGMGTKIMGALAGLAIADVLSKTIEEGFARQGTNNQLAAALNLSPEESKKIADATSEVFAGAYGESYEAVNENMRAIVGSVENGRNLSKDELVKMSQDIENLSATFGLEGGVITQAAQSMIGTGLADNWDDAMSTILAGYQTLGASGEDWIESLNEFSDDFVGVGLSGEQGLNLVNAAIKAGIKDTDAFVDGLNEVVIKINDMSADESLTALGLDPNHVREEMKKGGDAAQAMFSEIVTKLQASGDRALWAGVFGTKAEDYALAFQNFNIDSLNEPLAEGIGNMEKFNETLGEGGASSLEAFKRSITDAFITTLTPVLTYITPILASFVGWLKENEGAAMALSIVFGVLVVTALIAATVAAWGLVVPFLPLIGTVLLVVAAIAAVGAIIWLIATNWDSIVNWITEKWAGFAGWFGETFASMTEGFSNFGKTIANAFIGNVNLIIGAVNWLIDMLNGLQFTLPDWAGGYSFGGFGIPNVSEIPALAKGAVVKPVPGGTLARLAEKGKAEAVVDEGKLNGVLDGILSNGMGGNTPGVQYNIYQQPGESTEELVQRINSYNEFNALKEGYNFNG